MSVNDLRDPFSFLLQEVAARDAGLRSPWEPGQREQVMTDLLVAEAEETANGLRHVSVVHGEPTDPVEAELIDDLLAMIREKLSSARSAGLVEQIRLAGSPSHLTVTVGGPEAQRLILWVIDAVVGCRRPAWRVLETPRV